MNDVIEKITVSPQLLCNNYKKHTKVIKEIEDNFNDCDSFDLSIAFISDSGIAAIRESLDNVISKGIKGRIITSTYLGFNSPKMFKNLYNLFYDSNIQIKIYQKKGFHPKGYIFSKDKKKKIIIGSSNLTQDALSVNQEWNICLQGNYEDEIVKRIDSEFNEQWKDKDSVYLSPNWIKNYEKEYLPPIKYYVAPNGKEEFKPNEMQVEALECLDSIRHENKDKALLISATGTGKTYLSAFDVREFKAKRMLFVVHRETIARKSMESYKKVIHNKTMGMFTGSKKENECDYLFSTVNTISKYANDFDEKEFDYIVIDEVHKAGAPIYKNIINHFKPKFLLGMSATPERTDNPQKIYEIFDYNVAYEIRLKQAMEHNLLCPFHYYGITDLIINDKTIDDKSTFNDLTRLDRAKHIINSIKKYGYSGEKPHGLIFVSRSEEAIELSNLFNKISDFKTIALTGNSSSNDQRSKAIQLLEEKDTSKDYLDYIFTVDLFNEGIDIPCLNQIVMARSTKSSIIFIQQLGRGLRKNDDKEFVTVIDIIGNYDNNFMIPIALSGSQKLDKDELRRFMHEGNVSIPGASTISFDQITKRRIYNSIDKATLNSMRIIKDAYQKLKARLGNKIPTLSDFDKYSSIDPLIIIKTKKSYYNFLSEYENDYSIKLNKNESRYIEYISTRFASGKRIQELALVKLLLSNETKLFEKLRNILKDTYNIYYNDKATNTLINEFTGNYLVGSGDRYKDIVLITKDGSDYKISDKFKKIIKNNDFVNVLNELLDFSINRYLETYSDTYLDTDLVLYEKYSYDDVFRLLNWNKSEVSLNVGGYKYDSYSNTFPVFINYDKTDAADSIKYKDEIVNREFMNAISKHPRSLDSKDAEVINNAKKNKTKIHMFIRKNTLDDIKEFYYLGLVEKSGDLKPSKDNNGENIFIIPYKFDVPIREDILSYIKN